MSRDYDQNLKDQVIEDLFFSEWSKLVRYAKTQLRQYGPDMIDHEGRAEEIVQEVFYTAYKKVDEVKASENPEGWLYNALAYKVKEALREDKKWVKCLDLLPVDEGTDSLPEVDEWEKLIPCEDYLLLRHIYIDGYTYKEMCDELSCTKSCLAMRLYRIKKSFKKKYENYFENE